MPPSPEIADLGVLPHWQSVRLFVVQYAWGDHDVLFFFGISSRFGTVTSFGFVSRNIVEELPVFFWQILLESRDLVAAEVRVLLLEVQQQLKAIGLDENLSDELVFPWLARYEDRTVEIASSRDDKLDQNLEVTLVDIGLVCSYALTYQGHQILQDK